MFGSPFVLSKAIQPTDNRVNTEPMISVSVAVSMMPLATRVPPMKVNRWRSKAMTADFIKGSFGVSGVSGLRLRNNLICSWVCWRDSRLRIVPPNLQRRELRKVRAKFRTGSLPWVGLPPKGCRSTQGRPRPQGKPQRSNPCREPAPCQRWPAWGMRTCGR